MGVGYPISSRTLYRPADALHLKTDRGLRAPLRPNRSGSSVPSRSRRCDALNPLNAAPPDSVATEELRTSVHRDGEWLYQLDALEREHNARQLQLQQRKKHV